MRGGRRPRPARNELFAARRQKACEREHAALRGGGRTAVIGILSASPRSMPEVTTTVLRSMGEAAAVSSELIQRCVDHAVAELQGAEQHAASTQQRQDIAAAWRHLLLQRGAWSARYPKMLAAAFEEAVATDAAPAKEHDDDLSFDALTLVDEGQIARQIESARLAQQLVAALDRPLADLDALMSSALGLPGIRPERNPLRPEIYAQVLRTMMGEVETDPGWPALWLRTMAQPLAQGLEQVYRNQAQLLTQARVQAAGYRVLGTPSRPAPLAPISAPAPLGPAGGAGAGAGTGGGASSGGSPAAGATQGSSGGFGGSGAASNAGASNGSQGARGAASTDASANAGAARNGAAAQRSASDAAEARASGHAPLAGEAPAHAQPVPLRQFLLRGMPSAPQAPGASYYAAVDAELRAVESSPEDDTYDPGAARRFAHMPSVDRPARHVGTDSPLPREVWGEYSGSRARSLVRSRLKSRVRDLGQAYGLEVVRALVDQVAQDPRLLGPVREAIVGLEPSLLRLAMVAPRFFSDEEHPGRLLLERVAERSFKYNDEFSVEFQGFFVPVGQGFQRLNQVEEFEDAEPFRQLLATLQAGWAAQDTLDAEGEQRVVASVQFAERRHLEAQRIAMELRQREDLQGVPEPVQDFVLGTWALVIAHARLTETGQGLDPGGYLAVVTDLLWSVKRELTLHQPAHAFELIPRVLGKLRGGLAMLGQEPEESDSMFRTLETLHRPVLKLRARHRHRDLAPPEPPPVATPARAKTEPEGPWMAQRELSKVGFEDTTPSNFAVLAANDEPVSGPVPFESERVIAGLAVGSWVDLHSRQQWRRARLVWASERSTLFMFVSHGGQPHSMTRRTIQRLLQQNLLRPVDREAVVPRALASLGDHSMPAALAA